MASPGASLVFLFPFLLLLAACVHTRADPEAQLGNIRVVFQVMCSPRIWSNLIEACIGRSFVDFSCNLPRSKLWHISPDTNAVIGLLNPNLDVWRIRSGQLSPQQEVLSRIRNFINVDVGVVCEFCHFLTWPSLVVSSCEVSRGHSLWQTTYGDIEFGFYPDVAPKTVAHIMKLVRLGAYNTNHFFRVRPYFLPERYLI